MVNIPADLREYVNLLRKHGEIVDIDETVDSVYDISSLCCASADKEGPALYCHKVKNSSIPVLANLMGTRKRLALAFGIEEGRLQEFVRERLKKPLKPVITEEKEGTCLEITLTGEEADISKLPVPLWNTGDGGPYITGGVIIGKHPRYGYNAAIHRCQVFNGQEIGVYLAPDHHLRKYFDDASPEAPFPVAIAIGAPPALVLSAASDLSLGQSEIDTAGGLMGQPLPLVRGEKIDLMYPAKTEIVLETVYEGKNYNEGPFVEFTGYQTPDQEQPVLRVVAIRMRRNPVFHAIYAGKPPSETATVWRELEESIALDILQGRFPMVEALHRPPQVGRDFMLLISLKEGVKRKPGLVQNILLASTLAVPRAKFVIALDSDINIYNLTDVMWALCTRVNPARDSVIIPETMTSPLDPAGPTAGLSSKMLINATKQKDFIGILSNPPKENLENAEKILENYLKR